VYSIALLAALLWGYPQAASSQEVPPAAEYGQPAIPQVVAQVELALQRGDLASASALVQQYRRLHGDTPEALQALSWVARGELAAGRNAQAFQTAEEIRRISQASLGTRPLDAEPHLPLALGAAYEVEAEALFQQNQRAQALLLLQKALKLWQGTSLADRLQKNINLITLQGRPMPLLAAREWIGAKPSALNQLRGKVVLLFFWAHWCPDCKADAPVMAKLAQEFGPSGLTIIAPTRRYGYTATDEHAAPAVENAFIRRVFEHYYSQIPNLGIPLDSSNFQRFGVSTTPTIVLVDRRGLVRLYHPGLMSEADLRGALEPLLATK
jgi:thiol-disulfide isomerase/thioredoxin